ncbi:MAG: Gfo/Idh/MocA family protein [Eubacteriales bacterium]
MNNAKLRIGFLGCGQRGQMLVSDSLAFPEVEVVALCDLYEDRTESLANEVERRQGSRPLTATDPQTVIDCCPDAILIATPWESHVKLAIRTLRAGIPTGMEVGGAATEAECRELIRAWEETHTPFMLLENCCYGKRETMLFRMAEEGFFGEIVHCDGAYAHDLRYEVSYGKELRHYRLNHYLNENCENYPTHELGPIAWLLKINRGNRMIRLTSMSSKAAGLHEYISRYKSDDVQLINAQFAQGDVVTTNILCAGGQTITLRLDTTLPRTYSRGLTVHGTRALYQEEGDFVFEDDGGMGFHVARPLWGNASAYEERYLPSIWKEEVKGGHGGMDYQMLRDFYTRLQNGQDFPIDVYDAAAWMSVTYLSRASIEGGSIPMEMPDFTDGRWKQDCKGKNEE